MTSRVGAAWFRQPIAWLGAAILATTLAGCIVTLVLALRHADTPVATHSDTLLKVPLRHSSVTSPPKQEGR